MAGGGQWGAEKYRVCGAGVNLPSLGNQVPDPVLPGGELVSADAQTGTPAPDPCPPGTSQQGQVTWTTCVQTMVHLYRPPGHTDTHVPRLPFLVPLCPRKVMGAIWPTGLPPGEDVDSALKVISVPLRCAQADSPLKHCL